MSPLTDLDGRLLSACRFDDVSRVRALIEAGADVNAKNNYGRTALMAASKHGDVERVRALIEAGADMDAGDNHGYTALMAASKHGDVERVRALIEARADVNATDNDGCTALMAACGEDGDAERVRALIEARADVNARNNIGETALMFASGKSISFASGGDIARVRALIEAEADMDARDNYGRTALMDASRYGDVERVRALIVARADVNAQDNNGETALMFASRVGDIERVRALIEAGADVNACDYAGKTSLMLASGYGGDVERVRALIEAGADVNATCYNHGRTALMEASGTGGDVESVSVLIEAGADVNARDDDGDTALMAASWFDGDVERVRALIKAGADVNAKNNDGWTALMFASGYGDVEKVRALIESGADVNAKKKGGWTALMIASGTGGDVERVRALIEARADANVKNNERETALSIAMERGKTEVVAYLRVTAYLELQESQAGFASLQISDHGEQRGTSTSAIHLHSDAPVFAPDIDSPTHADSGYQARDDHAEVDSSHITLGRELGQGSYATVYEGTWHGVTIAVKRIRPPHGSSWSSVNQDLFRQVFEDQVRPEVNIMSAIKHPFVVGCYGCCVDPPSILLELCPRGSLGQMLQACREDASLCRLMTWRQRLCMLRQVASAMKYLHSRNVFHRDLRAMNVLVAQDMTTKVSDVGLGKFVDQVSSRSAGTLGDGANPRWLAPELVSEDAPFTQACDVYGFGTIVWEMMEWHLPWENMSSVQIMRGILQKRGLEVAGQDRWSSLPGPAPQHVATLPGISSLAQRCLSTDPCARPSFEDIVHILLELEDREPEREIASNVASGSQGAQNCVSRTDALNRLTVCCVCLDADADTIMSGCGHLCLCQDCSEAGQLSSCPTCRTPGLPQRIYFA